MNIFKKQNFVSITFDDGTTFTDNNCTEELWQFLLNHSDDPEAVKEHVIPKISDDSIYLKNRVEQSSILEVRGTTVCMPSVSELSIPKDFVEKILEAEETNNETELNKYKNFWTLVSLNPDSRVRDNIFWFIRRWDIQLTDSGFIICYRNANIYQKSPFTQDEIKSIIAEYYTEKYINNKNPKFIEFRPNESLEEIYQGVVGGKYAPVFTDQHSHTTRIKLGQPVSMDRSKCDCDSNVSCSTGLHAAAKGWLKRNYFGQVGLQVLVNPAKVTAIPVIDDYGKLRCCEYFPVALVDFDENGDVIESPISLYNDIEYLKHIKYDGEINNEEAITYEVIRMHQSAEEMYDDILRRLHGTE